MDGPATRLHPSSHPHTHPTTTSHSKGVIFVERRGEYSFMDQKKLGGGGGGWYLNRKHVHFHFKRKTQSLGSRLVHCTPCVHFFLLQMVEGSSSRGVEVQPGSRGEMWREPWVGERWRCPVQSLPWYVNVFHIINDYWYFQKHMKTSFLLQCKNDSILCSWYF